MTCVNKTINIMRGKSVAQKNGSLIARRKAVTIHKMVPGLSRFIKQSDKKYKEDTEDTARNVYKKE